MINRQITHFNPQEVQQASRQLVNLLQQVFRQQGNQGAALGVFPVIGRGDGSLEDSYRLAQPSDNFRHYHLRLNARLGKYDPVHTFMSDLTDTNAKGFWYPIFRETGSRAVISLSMNEKT